MASKTQKAKQQALAISTDTYNVVYERDGGCVLCQRLGVIDNKMNIMHCHHIITRARMGKGIPENLVMLCYTHHQKVNFYNDELEKYMKEQYDNWNKESLRYKKYE